MSNKKFSEISDPSDLVAYLKEPQRLNNVISFSKYMKLSSVIRMFNSGLMLINNPSNMNDLYEYSAFKNCANWSKICFVSLITQSTESMAMWSMYAQPWSDGVRISFPANTLKDVIRKTKRLLTVKKDIKTGRYETDGGEIPAEGILSLARIVYRSGSTITCTNRNDRNRHFKNPYVISELAGYVKDAAWDYEKEVRLRVDLPDDYNQDAVFIELDDSVLKQITITTGPRFKGRVKASLPQQYKKSVSIKTSKFNKKLAWIPCDDCTVQKTIP